MLNNARKLDYFGFALWKKKKFRVNKPLFVFRTAQFLWHGAGVLPSLFLGIFLKQRGLSLFELSSVFSTLFLFMFITSYITGIIADKIGNAKPVLMFLMLSTSLILVSMSFMPNINSISCKFPNKNINSSDLSKNSQNFSSCYINCLLNNKNSVFHEEIYSNGSKFKNDSTLETYYFDIHEGKNSCNFSSSQLADVSFDSLKNNCCSACIDSMKTDCVTVRQSHLVVIYSILVIAFYSVWNPAYRFMNFTSVSLATKNDSHLGKELAIARCGDALVIILASFILNIGNSSGSGINFGPVIAISAGIMFCASLTLSITTVPIFPPARNLISIFLNLLRNEDILAFSLLVFASGNGFAFNYTFHVVFLEIINAPRIVVALHSTATVVYGFPVLLTSKWFLNKFGANNIFVLGLLFYTINFAAYSYIENPWWSLIIDITVVFYFDLFWVAIVMHCWNVAPVGFAATLIALIGAVHFGIGCSSGVFFGGMLISYMGLRNAFRIMAAVLFVTAVLYSIFIYKRHRSLPANNEVNGTTKTEEHDFSR